MIHALFVECNEALPLISEALFMFKRNDPVLL